MPVGQNLSSSAYSNWRYTLNPAAYSASIKEGNNKITAKMLCEGNPVSITKFYSINVTGVNEILPELVTAGHAFGFTSVFEHLTCKPIIT